MNLDDSLEDFELPAAAGASGSQQGSQARSLGNQSQANLEATAFDFQDPGDGYVKGQNYFVIPGKRTGSKVYIHNNHGYWADKKGKMSQGNFVHLRCQSKPCKARGKIINDFFHVTTAPDGSREHTCNDQDTRKAQKWVINYFRDLMKRRAGKESTSLQRIYVQEMSRAPHFVQVAIEKDNCLKTLSRVRQQNIPAAPKSFVDAIKMFEEGGQYPERFEAFYQGSVTITRGAVTFVAMIYADRQFVDEVMAEAESVYIDATFKTSPKVSKEDKISQRRMQVLNFLAEAFGHVYPIFHVVMGSKRFPLYQKLFAKIVELFPSFRPKFIMTDWERALRKAIKLEIAGVRLLGCRFHYAKSLYGRIVVTLHLAGYYRVGASASVDHKTIGHILRQFMALPLLKAHDMGPVVSRLISNLRILTIEPALKEKLRAFTNYVVKYWLRGIGSENLSVAGYHQKTNNLCERFQRKMNETVVKHRSLFNFLQIVQTELTAEGKLAFAQKKAGKFLSTDHTSREEKLNAAFIEKLEKDYLAVPPRIDATTYLDTLASMYQYFDDKVLENHVDPEDREREENIEDDVDPATENLPPVPEADDDFNPPPEEPDLWESEEQDWTVPAPGPSANNNVTPESAIIVCGVCGRELKQLYVHSRCEHTICHVCLTFVNECTQCRQKYFVGHFRRLHLHLDIASKGNANNNDNAANLANNDEDYYDPVPDDYPDDAGEVRVIDNQRCVKRTRPEVPVPDVSKLPVVFTLVQYDQVMRKEVPGHYAAEAPGESPRIPHRGPNQSDLDDTVSMGSASDIDWNTPGNGAGNGANTSGASAMDFETAFNNLVADGVLSPYVSPDDDDNSTTTVDSDSDEPAPGTGRGRGRGRGRGGRGGSQQPGRGRGTRGTRGTSGTRGRGTRGPSASPL